MKKIIVKGVMSIPILRHLVAIIKAIIRLPQSNAMFQEQLDEYKTINEELNNIVHEQQTFIIQSEENICELNKTIAEQKTYMDSLKEVILSNQKYYDGLESCMHDNNWPERLNLQLSNNPTLWGSRERLHISKLASVFTCFFNTNSGEITIGDYTFAGSGVSLLAGSHDMYLEGLPRRDAEIKSGCDIIIGNGVWLGSGCTLLGPCTIGDNAVIGAGAVVTPGTKIPDNALCVGMPAKVIKKIDTNMNIHGNPIRAAVNRENGVLFVSGWTEKRSLFICGKKTVIGHWMIGRDSTIYTDRKQLRLLCHCEDQEPLKIFIQTHSGKIEVILYQNNQEICIPLEYYDDSLYEVHILTEYDMDDKLFMIPI